MGWQTATEERAWFGFSALRFRHITMTDNRQLPDIPPPDSGGGFSLERLHHYLALTFSLPERTARALSAIVGGGTLLLGNTLIPKAFRATSSYHFTLGLFQSFLIRNMAGIHDPATTSELGEQFMQRKLIGSSLEAAGLLTMHLSPVWVFAIAADTARGGQVFLQRLVSQLKENGVISPEAQPTNLEQLLQSIVVMGQQGAAAIDTPPMTRDEIRKLADDLRQSTATLSRDSTKLLPDFESIWNQISLVAKKENMSIEQIMGILSVNAASMTSASRGTADAVTKTGLVILDEMLLADYKETLSTIQEAGAGNYMASHMRPFLKNAQSHFDFRTDTASQKWYRQVAMKLAGKLKLNK